MTNKINPHTPLWFFHIAITCITMFACICLAYFPAPTVKAEEHAPGGNLQDPAVLAAKIATPSVVRIITAIEGRITVEIPDGLNTQQTFPLDGSRYEMEYTGSGAFISANGDILTAHHVVDPSSDTSIDLLLIELASAEIADYINNNYSANSPFTPEMIAYALISGEWNYTPSYEDPKSYVFLNTSYTGTITAKKAENMPKGTYVEVDEIKKESSFTEKDTAIIHVDLKDTPSIPLSDASHIAPMDDLILIGFPGAADVSLTNKLNTALTPSIKKLYVSAIKETDNHAPVIQVGDGVERGDSGGPAIDKNGNIVGIVSFGLGNATHTTFLQSSKTAMEMIKDLKLDLTPGTFQKTWSTAMTEYASTEAGHWQRAYQNLKQLSEEYPTFKAVTPYLDYAREQASKETPAKEAPDMNQIILIVASAALVIIVIGMIIIIIRRRQTSIATMPVAPAPMSGIFPPVAPTYGGTGHLQSGNVPGMVPANTQQPALPGLIPATPITPEMAAQQFSQTQFTHLSNPQPAEPATLQEQATPWSPFQATANPIQLMGNQPSFQEKFVPSWEMPQTASSIWQPAPTQASHQNQTDSVQTGEEEKESAPKVHPVRPQPVTPPVRPLSQDFNQTYGANMFPALDNAPVPTFFAKNEPEQAVQKNIVDRPSWFPTANDSLSITDKQKALKAPPVSKYSNISQPEDPHNATKYRWIDPINPINTDLDDQKMTANSGKLP